MAKDAAYRKAERKIEEVRKSGVTGLDLRSMKLTELPESLRQLKHLKILDLGWDHRDGNKRNQLTELPDWVGELTQLEELTLSYNQLTTLPEALGQLTQLQTLNLSGNQLTALPEALSQLTQLQKINLFCNQLIEMPECLLYLKNLGELWIAKNQLRKIPSWIKNFQSLTSLGLHGNQLTNLPGSFGDLSNLRHLRLGDKFNGGNPLANLPDCIKRLKKLSQLWIEECHLKALPNWLGELVELTGLYLRTNRINDLPASLAQLEHLKELELDNNPLNPELAAAYEQGLDAVKAYLRANAEAQIALNEAKLILIGEGGVGKTSLLAALRGEEWVENRKTTHGVEVDIKSLVLTDPDSDTEITLNGWDFGGQNIYRHTHQLFFTAPAVYLAVWEPRRGPEQCAVNEWIKMVKHRAYDEDRPDERPRILVVATHGGPKERLDHIDEQALRDEFGDLIVGFHHVDNKPDANGVCYGLDDLKESIARVVASIPQVGRKVPASWKRVLDALRQRGEQDAWVTYAQFQTLCREQEVPADLADTYAAILNELGHLIHYSSDPV